MMANAMSVDQQEVYCHCLQHSEYAEDNPTTTGRNDPDMVIDTNETTDISNVDSMMDVTTRTGSIYDNDGSEKQQAEDYDFNVGFETGYLLKTEYDECCDLPNEILDQNVAAVDSNYNIDVKQEDVEPKQLLTSKDFSPTEYLEMNERSISVNEEEISHTNYTKRPGRRCHKKTKENIEACLLKERELHKVELAKKTESQNEIKRRRAKERMRLKRQNETMEEKEQRLQKNNWYKKKMTESQKVQRRLRDKEYQRLKRQNETEEEKKQRLLRDKQKKICKEETYAKSDCRSQ